MYFVRPFRYDIHHLISVTILVIAQRDHRLRPPPYYLLLYQPIIILVVSARKHYHFDFIVFVFWHCNYYVLAWTASRIHYLCMA